MGRITNLLRQNLKRIFSKNLQITKREKQILEYTFDTLPLGEGYFVNAFTEELTLDQVRQQLNDFLQALNPSFEDLPEEIQGTVLEIGSAVLYQQQGFYFGTLGRLTPVYQDDDSIVGYATSLDLVQQPQRNALVVVRFTGTNNTLIPRNTRCSNVAEDIFVRTIEAGIVVDGQADVICYEETGANVIINANTITVLKDIVPGITSIDNPDQGVPRQDKETTPELRDRVYNKLRGQKLAQDDLIISNLLNVDGVSRRLISAREFIRTIIENTTLDEYKIKYLDIVVGGGKEEEVALAIYESVNIPTTLRSSLTPGDPNIKVVEIIRNTNIYLITFSRPVLVSLEITITYKLATINVETTAFEESASEGVVNYVNNLFVGQGINLLQLDRAIINQVEADGVVDGSFVLSLSYSFNKGGSPASPVDGVVIYKTNEYSNISADDLTFVQATMTINTGKRKTHRLLRQSVGR